MHFVTVGVAAAAIVKGRLHACDANGDLVQSLAPGATEAVGDDHRYVQSGAHLELAMNVGGRAVGIERQQYCGLAAVHVRNVDAAVGTDQAMRSLGDKHMLTAHHPLSFAQGEFDDTGVGAVPRGETFGGGRWLHSREFDGPAFRLGDDFVLDYENVSGVQAQSAGGKGLDDEGSNGIPRQNVANPPDGDGVKFGHAGGLRSKRRWHQPAASQASVSGDAIAQERSRRWAWVLPSCCASISSSCGLSMSRPMPGISRMISGLPVSFIASQWGRKLSLPKRSGMMDAGRRSMQLLPRRS